MVARHICFIGRRVSNTNINHIHYQRRAARQILNHSCFVEFCLWSASSRDRYGPFEDTFNPNFNRWPTSYTQRSLTVYSLLHQPRPASNYRQFSPSFQIHHTCTMCNYWRMESICGHYTLFFGSSCYLIYDQLQRINDPAERAQPGLPFQIPQRCLPNRQNIIRRYLNDYCSFECRNNGVYADGRCGTTGARYGPGSNRIGVGWR